MILALPSSPHWAPTTTVTGMRTLLGHGLERARDSTVPPTCADVPVLTALPGSVGTLALVAVMRIRRWADMSDDSQAALLGAWPRRRSSIRAAGVDRRADRRRARARRRRRVRRAGALRRHRGRPRRLRVTDDEIDAARVDDDVDRAIDDAIAHLRAFNEQQLARIRRLVVRVRAGADGRREDHADRVGRPVHAVRQGELSERDVPTARAGDRRRRAADRRRRAAGPGRARRGRPGRAGRVPQARPARRVPRQRPGRHRRPRVRHRDASQPCARWSGPARRRSRSPRSRCSASASPR